MIDLEERLRTELSAWADEAPEPQPWAGANLVTLRPPASHRPHGRWVVAAAAAVVVALLAAAVVTREDGGEPVASDRGGRLASIPVGEARGVRVLAAGGGAIFVASENDGRLYRIDTTSDEVTAGPELGVADAVAVSDAGVFAIVGEPPRVARFDRSTFRLAGYVELDGDPIGLRMVDDLLWVIMEGGTMATVDPWSRGMVTEHPFFDTPGFISSGGAGVWRTDLDTGDVAELDGVTGATLRTIDIGGRAGGLVVGDDAVWVADEQHDEVVRVDAASGDVVARVAVGRFPHGLALDGDRLWVTTFLDGRLVAVDTTTDRVATDVPIGVRPGSVVLADGSLWVAIHQQGLVVRLDPDRIDDTSPDTQVADVTTVELADGAHLVIRCTGSGGPAVVLESAVLGVGEWTFVQNELARHTRVCSYDRAALGPREGDATTRSAADAAAELHDGLIEAGVVDPFVLVGNGMGGLYARVYAGTYPDDVRALVLVDAVTPSILDELRPALGPDERAAFDEGFTAPPFQRAEESLAQAAAVTVLGDRPVLVVTPDPGARDPAFEPDLWVELQRAQVDLSTDSRLVEADGVGYELPVTAPAIVVQAIADLLADIE